MNIENKGYGGSVQPAERAHTQSNSFQPKLCRLVAMIDHHRRKIDIIRYVVPDNSENIDFNDEA